ncbi:MAG: 23S rRNA (uracil(1939)-C(5))-methyltransferase RlmD [Coxiellaceae bacterium]|nr:23S rRNA (uracil(1939)-C(5))-methyltransferase RlmD [Coxiellaceae bacterium]
MSKRRRKKVPAEIAIADITHLSHEGRGIAHLSGKATFLFGGLPGENVHFRYTECKKQYDEGMVTAVANASPDRVTPKCQHFGVCGGCALQHLSPSAQRTHKENVLLEHFQHQANITPAEVLLPLQGDEWGYRRRARLSVRYVIKKDRVLVGFRERQSGFVADIQQCETLHPSIGYKLSAFSDVIMQMDAKRDIAQLEISIGDNASVFIVRHLAPLPPDDLDRLITFARVHELHCYLQPGNEDTIHPLYPENPDALYYEIPAENLRLYFQPSQFTQINQKINLQMIARAIDLLDCQKTDRVLDLFCGMGNFSLPIAKHVKEVLGVEGSEKAILQAKSNAEKNNIVNAQFFTHDLTKDCVDTAWGNLTFDKVLLDPARAGAKEILSNMTRWNPSRIVYVSCNPITLARDTKELLLLGYRLEKAGVMDMFPHTEHVEAIALFSK